MDQPRRAATRITRGLIALLVIAIIFALAQLRLPSDVANATPVHKQLSESQPAAASNELTVGKAALLGLVEGFTEYLPISSSGHLIVAERLMGIGTTDATKDAADTYTIAIQFGAILAVIVLYFARLRSMAEGVIGRDPAGRRTLNALVIATIPAVVIGLAGEKFIKSHLLTLWPVVAAWIVGAIVLFATADRFKADRGGVSIDKIQIRQALIIGGAQCIALWPGTSRSLATIIGALVAGLSLGAAVEFSFLLGLVTLSGATAYELVRHGGELVEKFGLVNPLVGGVVAFLAAIVAVRWMVAYLEHHDLRIFAWYRTIAAVATIVLISTQVITA